jgi:hypothetical protein
MTQTKTGAFPSMGRIPQLFGHTVLAASMLAGGASLLNAGGAMADTVSCPGTTSNGFSIALTSDPNCKLTSPLGGVFPNLATVDYDFPAPELPGPTSGVFTYSLTAPNGDKFIAALVDSDLDLLGSTSTTVRKEIFGDAGLSVLLWDNTSTNGSNSTLLPFTSGYGAYNTVYVRDTYNVASGAVMDNYTNTLQTPGPLPILGAGAAFGFSRKLRGRIKAARLG